jgi:hypothetical protein
MIFFHYLVSDLMGGLSAATNAEENGGVKGKVNLAPFMTLITGASREAPHPLAMTDRVYEYRYLRGIVCGLFARTEGARLKTGIEILNRCLLSLLLGFSLYKDYSGTLDLPLPEEPAVGAGQAGAAIGGLEHRQ